VKRVLLYCITTQEVDSQTVLCDHYITILIGSVLLHTASFVCAMCCLWCGDTGFGTVGLYTHSDIYRVMDFGTMGLNTTLISIVSLTLKQRVLQARRYPWCH
jgi:hypothetical protein